MTKIFPWLALLSCAGCGFSSAEVLHPGDMGRSESAVDFAGLDLLGVDLTTPPGGNDDMAASGGCNSCNCGQPVLLVAVESFSGFGGSVLQLGLGTGGTPISCGKALTVGGTLSKSPNSLGWLPPDAVIFGAPDGTVLIDAVKDLERWTYHTNLEFPPLNVFPLQNGATTEVAIAFDSGGFDDISEIDIVDPRAGTKTMSWDITNSTSPIFLGDEVAAMVQSPLDPSHILFVNDDESPSHPAEDVAAPFDGNLVKPTVYVTDSPSGDPISTINAVRNAAGGLKRVAWLQHGSVSLGSDNIFYANDDGTGPPLFTGPLGCNLAQCKQPFAATDAVVDPTAPNRVFAVCNSPTDAIKHVVRIDDSGNCTLILDGNTLATNTNPFVLAIAEAQ